MSPMTKADVRDTLVADAKSMPDLIAKAKAADPALAQQLEGKALLASKTVWGTAASMVLSWAVTKYGLGWDADMCALVSGLIVMATTAALRAITKGPITTVIPPKPRV